MLDLGLWSEKRREYMLEKTCLCGSVLVHISSKGVYCLACASRVRGLFRKCLSWKYDQYGKEWFDVCVLANVRKELL